MRLALLSDIHGNFSALDAVLADLNRERVEQIVCLGDVAFNGPQPREVVARLRELACPIMVGNTDEFFLTLPTADSHNPNDERIMDIIRWGAAHLSSADVEFIRTFKLRVEIALDDDKRLLCFHGSPQSNSVGIFATTPDDDLARMLGDDHAAAIAGGHTHTQMFRRYRNTTILTPGSVGMPIERDANGKIHRPPFAEYAILRSESNSFAVEFRRVPLDVDAIVRALRASGMPHAESLAQEWIS